MPSSKKAVAAGARNTFMGFIDEFGFLTGGSPTAPAAGELSFMTPILGITDANPATPEPESVNVEGDDGTLAEFDFDSTETRRFNINTSVQDLDHEAAILGTNVETLAEIYMGAQDIRNAPERNMCAILQSRAKKFDAGVQGQKAWNGTLVPLGSGRPLGRRAFEGRAAAAFAYSFTPQPAGYTPWGVTIAEDGFLAADSPRYIPLNSEYPVVALAFTGNAVKTEFTWSSATFAYSPVSVAKIAVLVDRVAVTVASVGTRSFTLSAAPRNGGRGIAVFQFQ